MIEEYEEDFKGLEELKKELDKIGFTKKDMKEFEELEKELDNMDCDNW